MVMPVWRPVYTRGQERARLPTAPDAISSVQQDLAELRGQSRAGERQDRARHCLAGRHRRAVIDPPSARGLTGCPRQRLSDAGRAVPCSSLSQRLLQMVLIMAVVSLILFAIFDSDKFKKQIAVNELGGLRSSALSRSDYQAWLEKKGLNVPFYERYLKWVGGVAARRFRQVLSRRMAGRRRCSATRLANTGILAFWVFALMIPLALVTGVIAGMREGSVRTAPSPSSRCFTSIPEIATAIILTVDLRARPRLGARRSRRWSAAWTGARWSCRC